jgi:hypothetical protein
LIDEIRLFKLFITAPARVGGPTFKITGQPNTFAAFFRFRLTRYRHILYQISPQDLDSVITRCLPEEQSISGARLNTAFRIEPPEMFNKIAHQSFFPGQ